MSASSNRFNVSLQLGKTPEESAEILFQQVISLTGQLNAASLPITVGPNENAPTGLNVGQPVIDWSSGTSQLKVWNGESLV